MNEEDGFDDIPTLTDVVRPGNPSLVFHLDGVEARDEEAAAATVSDPDAAVDTAPDEGADAAGDETSPIVELGLPEDFFTTPASEPEGLGNLDLFDEAGAPVEPARAAPEDGAPPPAADAGTPRAGAAADIPPPAEAPPTPAFDADSLLIRLEVPISEILQRHWESAREEILALIREELERQRED